MAVIDRAPGIQQGDDDANLSHENASVWAGGRHPLLRADTLSSVFDPDSLDVLRTDEQRTGDDSFLNQVLQSMRTGRPLWADAILGNTELDPDELLDDARTLHAQGETTEGEDPA